MPLTVLKHHTDQILTTLSISFTGMLGMIKFELLELNFNAIGETIFFYAGGLASTAYLVLKALNEFESWRIKKNEQKQKSNNNL